MKTSKFFLSTLIAASAMTATAYASDEPTITWNVPEGQVLKWNDAEKNWIKGSWDSTNGYTWTEATTTSPGRINNNSGSLVYYFDGENQSFSFSTLGGIDTSDGGGIVVTGTGNTVTTSIGRWAGSIQVDATNILNASWSNNLKDGNIVANGIVNITAGNLVLDGPGERIWWVGAEGSINFSTASTLSVGSVYLSGEINNVREVASLDGLANRELGVSVESKQMLSFATGLTSGLDLLSVGDIKATSGVTLNSVAERDALATKNQYFVEKSSSGVVVYYTVEGSIQNKTLVWNGTSDDSNWVEKGTSWLSSSTTTSFVSGDDVVFDSSAQQKTVTLIDGGAVSVGVATIKSGSNYLWRVNGSKSSIEGRELNVESGATLKVGDSDGKVVDLAFDKVAVSGTLNYYNGADSWSSLALSGGGCLKLGDLPSGSGLSISETSIAGEVSITADWDGKLSLGKISGDGSLSVSGPEAGNAGTLNVTIGGLSDYTGEVKFISNRGLSVELNGANVADAASYTKELGNDNLEVTLGESVSFSLSNAMSKFTYKTLTMKDGSSFAFSNGNTWGNRDITGTINVDAADGLVTIKGGTNGNSSNIAGTITGVGTVAFEQISGGGNNYSVSAKITDKSESELLAVKVDLPTTLTFSGDNSYSGGTTISAGKLSALHKNALGGGAVSIANGAELNLHTSVTVAGLNGESEAKITAEQNGYTLEVAGGGEFAGKIAPGGVQVNLVKSGADDSVLTISGSRVNGDTEIRSGTLVAASSSALGSGDVTVGTKGTLALGTETVSVKNLSGDGTIKLADGTTKSTIYATYDNDEVLSANIHAGSVAGGAWEDDGTSINFVKRGSGMLTLSQLNTFFGDVTVESGTLYAATSGALSGSKVIVELGATLKLAPSVNDWGVMADSYEFKKDSSVVVDLGYLAVPADADTVDSITVSVIAAEIIKFGDMTLSEGENLTLPEGYVTFANDGILSTYVNQTWAYDGSTLSLTLAIPEPSAFGLLAGLGALALVGTRRRRR